MRFLLLALVFTTSAPALLAARRTEPPRVLLEQNLASDNYWEALAAADGIAAAESAAAPRSKALRQAGELRLRLGDLPGAEKNFKTALELSPEDPDLPRLVALAERDRPGEESVGFAERAARAGKASPAARARAFLLAAELRIDLGDRAGAERDLAEALKLTPEDLDALDATARLTKDKAYAERAERSAAAQPAWLRPSAYRQAARLWLELKETSRAVEDLRLSLRPDPENLAALGMLAVLRGKLSPAELAGLRRAEPLDWPEAPASQPELRAALERDPDDLAALRALAVLAAEGKRTKEAAARASAFLDAARRAPLWRQAAAYRELAALWTRLGDAVQTRQNLKRSTAVEPDSIAAQLELLKTERETTLPNLLYIYCTAAESRLAFEDAAGARVLITRALELNPADAWSLRIKEKLDKTKDK